MRVEDRAASLGAVYPGNMILRHVCPGTNKFHPLFGWHVNGFAGCDPKLNQHLIDLKPL